MRHSHRVYTHTHIQNKYAIVCVSVCVFKKKKKFPQKIFCSLFLLKKITRKIYKKMSDNQNDNLIFESADNQEAHDNQMGENVEPMNDDADLFDIKQRVKGMDEEAARLIQLQNEMEQQVKLCKLK